MKLGDQIIMVACGIHADRTGWNYGPSKTGFVSQKSLSGFPTTTGSKTGMSPTGNIGGRLPKPQGRAHGTVGHGTAIGTPRVGKPVLGPPRLKGYADYGEPMTGNMGHAHIEPVTWFHPPSLTKRTKNEDTRVPTDDPREDNDKYLDVTKRNSPDTKEQRMKLLKRQAPSGRIPAKTTLLEPHSAVYMPTAQYFASGTKKTGRRVFKAYGDKGRYRFR